VFDQVHNIDGAKPSLYSKKTLLSKKWIDSTKTYHKDLLLRQNKFESYDSAVNLRGKPTFKGEFYDLGQFYENDASR
jgi:hypothetical protein